MPTVGLGEGTRVGSVGLTSGFLVGSTSKGAFVGEVLTGDVVATGRAVGNGTIGCGVGNRFGPCSGVG